MRILNYKKYLTLILLVLFASLNFFCDKSKDDKVDNNKITYDQSKIKSTDILKIEKWPTLTEELKQEYIKLFSNCQIKSDVSNAVDKIVNKIKVNRQRYESVSKQYNIPWYLIAVIHNMESDLSFEKHFHNGDPLASRTVNEPVGRPENGNPPFTWEKSVNDAIVYDHLDNVKNWDLPLILYRLEGFNGFGYRVNHPNILSPYLWSYSNYYNSGKYTYDGVFSETEISDQCGAAIILKRMQESKIIDIIK